MLLKYKYHFYLLGEWQTIGGRFISVLGANISCRCAKSSTGISPHAHIGDGRVDLVLVRKTTRANYLHHLIKISEKTTEHVRKKNILLFFLGLKIKKARHMMENHPEGAPHEQQDYHS